MGAHSCGPLRSHVNSFLDFCFAFRIPAFLYKICFAFLCAPAFLFHVPLLLCQRAYIHMRGGWGCNTCTVCLWTDQTGQVNLPPVHYPPSSCVRSVQYKYTGGKPVWVRSNLCLVYNPPFHFSSQYTHNCVISHTETQI